MKFRIPKSVKVGGHILQVKMCHTNDTSKGNNNYGKTDFNTMTIMVEKDVARCQQEQTFLHELMHAVAFQSSVAHDLNNDKKLSEEEVVRRLSETLYQVFKDNRLFS